MQPKSFPGKESLDNFYFPMYRGVSTPLRIHMRDNPPLFAWLEWENYRFSGDKARVEGVLLREQFLQRHFRWFNTAPKGERAPYSSNPFTSERLGRTGLPGREEPAEWIIRRAGGIPAATTRILWVDAISQQALAAPLYQQFVFLAGEERGRPGMGRGV